MRLRIHHSFGVISLVSVYAPTEASDLTVKDAFSKRSPGEGLQSLIALFLVFDCICSDVVSTVYEGPWTLL